MGVYTNAAQQRLLKVQFILFDDVINGLSPSAISKAIGASAPTVTRDLANLVEGGVAERDEETGNYRLTPYLPQQTGKVWATIDAAERRLQESKKRFIRKPD